MCAVSTEIGKAWTVVDGILDSVEDDASRGLKREKRGLSPGKYDLSPRGHRLNREQPQGFSQCPVDSQRNYNYNRSNAAFAANEGKEHYNEQILHKLRGGTEAGSTFLQQLRYSGSGGAIGRLYDAAADRRSDAVSSR